MAQAQQEQKRIVPVKLRIDDLTCNNIRRTFPKVLELPHLLHEPAKV